MPAFSHHNSIKLIHGGKEFFELLEKLINAASYSIHLHTYIFEADETGNRVAGALIEAAKRNVKIYMLIDGYASKNLSPELINNLKNAGVRFRFFEPLLKSKSLYFGRRLHHKVFVSDAIHSLVGGINIANHYNDVAGHQAWLDYALYVHGDISAQLHKLSCKVWRKKYLTHSDPSPGHKEEPVTSGMMDNIPVRIRRNDWVRKKNEVWKTYLEIFRTAKHDITIVCSYFLPGTIFRRQLKKARARGVNVNIILTGHSDVKIAKYAERYLYRWMLRNKIKIYEYQPRILHAKLAMADEQLFTIGSFNVNNISAFASIELNLDVKHPEFCQKVQTELKRITKEDCIEIDATNHSIKFYTFHQFFRWCSFQLIRFMLTMTTFYFRQRE